jgi:hypothetical protein
MEEELRLKVTCLQCGDSFTHRCEGAVVCPPSENKELDWDGILLSSIVRCGRCGAVDAYELTGDARMWLLGGLLRSTVVGGGPEGRGRIMMGRAQTYDGHLVKRPTQGIAHLRALCDAQPRNGEAWRRLGNMCERYGQLEEAESAWRTAVEVDPGEAEAAYSLATRLWGLGHLHEGLRFVGEVLKRYPRATFTPGMRRAMIGQVVDILREASAIATDVGALMVSWAAGKSAGQQVVTVSSIDFRHIRDWDRLADFLASGAVLAVGVVSEIPEERPTMLERVLGGSVGLPGGPGVPLGILPQRAGRGGRKGVARTSKKRKRRVRR